MGPGNVVSAIRQKMKRACVSHKATVNGCGGEAGRISHHHENVRLGV